MDVCWPPAFLTFFCAPIGSGAWIHNGVKIAYTDEQSNVRSWGLSVGNADARKERSSATSARYSTIII
jgi:hypothetical protein